MLLAHGVDTELCDAPLSGFFPIRDIRHSVLNVLKRVHALRATSPKQRKASEFLFLVSLDATECLSHSWRPDEDEGWEQANRSPSHRVA